MKQAIPVNLVAVVQDVPVTSCVGLQEEEEAQTVLPHVLYMGISYSR